MFYSRVIFFVILLLCLQGLELTKPAYKYQHPIRHFITNIALSLCSQILLILFFIFNSAFISKWALSKGIGLFNMIELPATITFFLSIIILDLMIYLQHVAMHKFECLWRLHRVHHSDKQLCTSSGLRFHPLEALVSMIYRSIIILLLGLPVIGVIAFEIILNGMSLFTHTNISLSRRLDFAMRRLLVTPDMHRVHHSIQNKDQHRNYGFNLSLWDKLFKTYQTETIEQKLGIKKCTIDPNSVLHLLKYPFIKE